MTDTVHVATCAYDNYDFKARLASMLWP